MSFTFSKNDELRSAGRFSTASSLAQLLQQAPLFAGELARRDHADIDVEIAFAAAVRIGQALALQADNRAGLRAFGDSRFARRR